mmetsp:Transcript_8602/g.10629  ORF Transcript_8602/g.10629 Transcript_8602/m.10629 type:complete len:156 (+) Transcript_8602:168-635(+)
MTIIVILLMSIALVISEAVYRFTLFNLRYRFIQNAVAQWQVFICLTIMVNFTRRNGAASFTMPLRIIFILMHLSFGAILVFGILNKEFYSCSESKYPVAFKVQYAVFYSSYFIFLVLHYNGYFLKWHDSVVDLDTDAKFESNVERRHLRVRLIFE